MKKNPFVVPNPTAETLTEALGLTDDQRVNVQKTTAKICKEEKENGGTHSGTIARVWNEFETEAECMYALYILEHTEEHVAIQSLFSLPEVVGKEEEV